VKKNWRYTRGLGVFAIFALLTFAFATLAFTTLAFAGPTVIIEAEPDLQRVMGDLYALSIAMRLYHDDTRKAECPTLDLLEPYLQKPLPGDWRETCRTAAVEGDWWVGCQVPEFSRARKFLRNNAPALSLYDKDTRSAWLGAPFIWIRAVSFGEGGEVPRVVQGEQRLFFNSPGTGYYWWSDLLFTPKARSAALEKFGTADFDGKTALFVVPPPPRTSPETFTASPVSPPPDFTVENEEEELAELGGLIFNPVPRGRD
jgi:hypothetical protein